MIRRLSVCLVGILVTTLAGQDRVEHPQGPWRAELHGELSHTVTSFGAATHEGFLYVFGGAQGRPHHYDRHSQSPLLVRRPLAGGAFESLPSRDALQGVALVAVHAGLVRIGGMTSRNEPGTKADNHSSAEIALYDARHERWRVVGHLDAGRSSHDAVAVGEDIFVAGGWTLSGEQTTWCTDLVHIRLGADGAAVRSLALLPVKRRALALAALEGGLYAFGGIDETGAVRGDGHRFDLRTAAWEPMPTYPGQAFGLAAVAIKGRIVASGGDGQIWSLGHGESAWRAEGRQAFARTFHRLVDDGMGSVLVMGGIAAGGRVRIVERLRDDLVGPVIAQGSLPFEGRARNRSAMVLEGSQLLLFGGNDSKGQHDFDARHFTDEGFAFDLAAHRIRTIESFPAPRQSMLAAHLGQGTALFVGGFGPHSDGVARSHATSYQYDLKLRAFIEALDPLPTPRTQGQLALVERTAWLLGGLDYDPRRPKGEEFQHIEEILALDLAADSKVFEARGMLRRPRRAFGMAVLDGKIYCVGGMRENFQLVPECEVFDPATLTWSDLPAPAGTRLNPELVALDGRLFLLGGSVRGADREMKGCHSIEFYDPKVGHWDQLKVTLPIEPRHLRAFAHQGRLLLVSLQADPAGRLHYAWIDPGLPVAAVIGKTGAH